MNTFQLARQLEQIALQIVSLAKAVENMNSEYPAVPDHAKILVNQKICLGCKKPHEGRIIRGLHEKCFKALDRKIKSGDISEHDAISRGMLLPPNAGGRPPNVEYEQMFSELSRVAENPPEETVKAAKRRKASPPPAAD
jgi:hypothetical protein